MNMKNLLLLSLAVLSCCGPQTTENDGGDVPEGPPCDYVEWNTGVSNDLAFPQYIDTLPALSEYTICGEFDNQIRKSQLVIDYDLYLFPLVGEKGSTELVSFALDCESTHTPLIELFITVDDSEPVQLEYFVGTDGVVQVIEWPVFLQGDYKNDLIVRVSTYVFAPDIDSEYELRFW